MNRSNTTTDDKETAEVRIELAVRKRFGTDVHIRGGFPHADAIAAMNERSVCRDYLGDPLDEELVRLLCASALSSPSKSDLQQADIVRIINPEKRTAIHELLPGSPWISGAPEFFVICGNGRRLQHLFSQRHATFPNNHLDAFFNATVDAAIVLSAFVQAIHLAGLGACPISEIRDHSRRIQELLDLPDYVFPVAGLTVGYPRSFEHLSPRLPLEATVHVDRYNATHIDRDLAEYDSRRIRQKPFPRERNPARFGKTANYGWTEDKFRQYSDPQRTDFGAFIRSIGFSLD